MRHFSAFVTSGSLSGAARELGIEHATVARRISALEARLNLKLVDRRGRRLTLTADGEKVAALADRMVETIRTVERLADGSRSELRGEVTISAPPAYAALVLAPRLAQMPHRHPDLSIRLLGEAHTASLERREADIAVRLRRPESGDLTAVRIGMMAFHLYASPHYLVQTPEAERRFVGAVGAMSGSPQEVARTRSMAVVDGCAAFHSDHVEIQAALVAAGGGVGILPEFVALSRSDLVKVYEHEPIVTREVWLAIHSDMKNAAPIRVVIEALRTAA